MALPATDNFNRATGFTNSTWTIICGGANAFSIDSDAFVRPLDAASISLAYWDDDAFSDDQYSEITRVASSGQYVGVSVRAATGADAYAFGSEGGLYRYDNASGFSGQTTLGSPGHTPTTGDVLRIEAEGTTIRGLINSVEEHSVTDATYASGSAGLWGYSDGSLGDSWEGGDLGVGGGGFQAAWARGTTVTLGA